MSFFGITMLGPPSPYTVLKFEDAACISTDDFMESFRKVATNGDFVVNEANFRELISEALGPSLEPRDEDIMTFRSYWDEGTVIDQLQFANKLEKFHASQKLKPTKNYTSFRQYREDKLKHKRVGADPHQAMQGPLTTSQQLGWGGPDVTRRAKQSNAAGNLFAHKPSFMSFYSEFVACAEDGRDFVAGPTLKAVEYES